MKEILRTIESKSITWYHLKKDDKPMMIEMIEDEIKLLNVIHDLLINFGFDYDTEISQDNYFKLKELVILRLKHEYFLKDNQPIKINKNDEYDYFEENEIDEHNGKIEIAKMKLGQTQNEIYYLLESMSESSWI